MAEWFGENWQNILVVGIIIVVVLLIVVKLIRDKKKGRHCCCDCSNCGNVCDRKKSETSEKDNQVPVIK